MPTTPNRFPGARSGSRAIRNYLAVPADARSVLAQGAWTVDVRSVGVRGGASADGPLAPRFTLHVGNPFTRRIHAGFEVSLPAGAAGRFTAGSQCDLAPAQ